MVEQPAIQRALSHEFARRQIKNSSYSLRAFAQRLKMNSGALSSVLNGKRKISKKMACRLADHLCLNPQEKAQFLTDFSKGNQAQALHYTQLSVDQFNLLSEWHHFAIMSLIETNDFKNELKWIAKRLGVPLRKVRSALKRLQRLGLIAVDDDKVSLTHERYVTSDEISNISLQRSHAKNLELAKYSLERDALEDRDFSAITLAIDPKKIKEAKERIRLFLDEMSLLLEANPKSEVYKLCIQLIPLTRRNKQ